MSIATDSVQGSSEGIAFEGLLSSEETTLLKAPVPQWAYLEG
jgi:hypothetical protein